MGHATIDRVSKLLDEARQSAEKWERSDDPAYRRYDMQYRLQQASQIRMQAREQATEEIQRAIEQARSHVGYTRKALAAARMRHADTLDYARLQVEQTRIATAVQNARSLDEVTQIVNDLAEMGDEYGLRAFAETGLPIVRQRMHQEGGPWYGQAGDVSGLERTVTTRLRELEPDELREARAAFERAEQDVRAIESGVSQLNFRLQFSGMPGIEAPSRVVQTTNERGNTVFRTEGGW